MSLLAVDGLTVSFRTPHGSLRAVDRVSFELAEGETLGLVGESGSGKSVTSLAVLGLVPSPPGRVEAGSVRLRGRELLGLRPAELRRVRGREIAMIFQDPLTSLNPLLTIERQLTEVLEVHEGLTRRAARLRAASALGEVGVPEPEARLASHPHQLSGGLRQRVMIAMALLCRPAVLLADEPTTALDVTIQAQILELLRDLQARHGMGILLITHDLGVVAGMASRVHVMYAGRLVEAADTRALFRRPAHPYTRGLLASVPSLTGDPEAARSAIDGAPPDLSSLPPGCAFAPRCAHARERCRLERPELEAWSAARPGGVTRRAACFEAAAVLAGEAAG